MEWWRTTSINWSRTNSLCRGKVQRKMLHRQHSNKPFSAGSIAEARGHCLWSTLSTSGLVSQGFSSTPIGCFHKWKSNLVVISPSRRLLERTYWVLAVWLDVSSESSSSLTWVESQSSSSVNWQWASATSWSLLVSKTSGTSLPLPSSLSSSSASKSRRAT